MIFCIHKYIKLRHNNFLKCKWCGKLNNKLVNNNAPREYCDCKKCPNLSKTPCSNCGGIVTNI